MSLDPSVLTLLRSEVERSDRQNRAEPGEGIVEVEFCSFATVPFWKALQPALQHLLLINQRDDSLSEVFY